MDVSTSLMKKKVLFTFDYELFLGKNSGSVTNCLITPTEKVVALLNRYHFKAIFFIDTVYLLKLQEISEIHRKAREDFQLIITQLENIVRNGHEIHPHIHPHWLDAVYDDQKNQWSLLDKRFYQFSSLSQEQQEDLFKKSIDIISSIVANTQSTQPVNCYRAGGWSIQPFEAFKPFFIRHGIKYDFSVVPGRYVSSDAHRFDFRNAPRNYIYSFGNDVCKEDSNGLFIELPISSVYFNGFEKWLYFKVNGLYSRISKKEKLQGSTVDVEITEEGDLHKESNGLSRLASFEGLNPYIIRKYIAEIKKKDYYQFISHPKLILNTDFKLLPFLLKSIEKVGNVETDFRKFAHA
jgi:hypothetical protein